MNGAAHRHAAATCVPPHHMHSDVTSFAAAFKRMRAVGKQSESGLVSTDVQEPLDAGGFMQPLQRKESDSAAALQMQLQVTISAATRTQPRCV
jgi:hypothetical protein